MKNLWASACLVLATLCTTPVMADASGAAIGSDSDRRSYKVEKQVVHQRPVVVEKVIYVNNRNDYRPHHVKQRVVYYKNNHQRRHHHRHHD